jgi:hypothetical protein
MGKLNKKDIGFTIGYLLGVILVVLVNAGLIYVGWNLVIIKILSIAKPMLFYQAIILILVLSLSLIGFLGTPKSKEEDKTQ